MNIIKFCEFVGEPFLLRNTHGQLHHMINGKLYVPIGMGGYFEELVVYQ